MSLAHITIALLLVATVGCGKSSKSESREFRQIDRQHFYCNNNASKNRIDKCFKSANDCLIEEVSNATNTSSRDELKMLKMQEWSSLANKMQELANEAGTDDEYPDAMPVMKPLKELRNRICPVRYKVMLYEDTVPMLIVHAVCIRDKPAVNTTETITCEEIRYFRQVYERIPGCRAKDSTEEKVYIKHFQSVSVNCAAKYK